MAENKPTIYVWPASGQLKKGQSKVLDIILANGADDYDVVVKNDDKIEYDKAKKTLKSKGVVGDNCVVEFTPKKGQTAGDKVSITVNVIEGEAAADKPVLFLIGGNEYEAPINTEIPIDLKVQPAENTTYEMSHEDAKKVEYNVQKMKLNTKGIVTDPNKVKVTFTPKFKTGDNKGAPVEVFVKVTAAATATTELTLSAESGNVVIGTPVDVTVTTNASDFTVESKDQAKATVAKGSGKFTITGVKAGEVQIEVKATKEGASEAVKTYTATVQEAAGDKPTMTIDPMTVDLQVNGTKVLNITPPEGGDYNFDVKQKDKLDFDKASKTITAKAEVTGGKIGFTPTKNNVNGDEVEVTVNVTAAAPSPGDKPTIQITPNPVNIKVEQTQVLNIVLSEGADYDFEVKNDDKVGYDKASKTITGKAVGDGAVIDFTPKKDSTLGDKVSVTVNVAAKESGPVTTELTLNPADRGNVEIGKTLDVAVTTNASDFSVESKNTDKATVAKGSGKFTVTGVAVGEATIEVKATAAGGSEVVKQFVANVQEVALPPVPAPETIFKVEPQVITVVNKQKQVFTLANEGSALKVECEPTDAIEWNASEKSITAKRVGQFAVRFIKSETEVVVVNLTVSPEPSVWDKYENMAEVKKLLEDGSKDAKTKFDELDNSVSQYGSLVQSLSTYNAKMGPNVPNILPKVGAGQNYNLLNQIMYVVELSNKDDFKVQFDIINLYFKEYATEAYNEYLMQRFDNYWSWDAKALNTWTNLVTCICMLCDISTRAENLKKISLDRVLDPTTTLFSATAIANIKGYYVP